MITRLRRLIAGTRGSEIAEAALVFPIAFLILLSIYWFGRAFNVYATINHAARQGVRAAVTYSCGSCGNSGPNVTAITTQVGQALLAAHMDPNHTISETVAHPGCNGGSPQCSSIAGPPALYVCTNAQLVASPLPAAGASPCGVSVDFQYPYQMFLPGTILNQRPYKLSAHVQMRTEQ
jgi:hypothetical protein